MPTPEQVMTSKVVEQQTEINLNRANEAALENQQQQQQEILTQIQERGERQEQIAQPLLEGAQQAQQTQLALLGQGDQQEAVNNLLNSPLVQAINQQNQQNIQAQAAASGVSGGNLLSALQDRNTAAILNTGFAGLGQIAGQQQQGGLALTGFGQQTFGQGVQQQQNVAQSSYQNALFNAQVKAQPGINFVQGTQQQQQDLLSLLNLGSSLYSLGGGTQQQAQQPQQAPAQGAINQGGLL